MDKDVLILAIESSCDETAAAVVKNGRDVLSNIIYSQIELHKLYGGVVPEIAQESISRKSILVITAALKEAKVTLDDIDAIAVTYGPGLVGALLVGVAEAKAISYASGKPLVRFTLSRDIFLPTILKTKISNHLFYVWWYPGAYTSCPGQRLWAV